MCEFDELQGRLVVEVICYLEVDCDNEQLRDIFNELDVNISHPLISDFEVRNATRLLQKGETE